MKVRVMLRMRLCQKQMITGLFGTFLDKPARSCEVKAQRQKQQAQDFRAENGEKAFATHWSSKSVWRRMSCKTGFARSRSAGFARQNAHHRRLGFFGVKFDGYRCIPVKHEREITLFSRNKKVLNKPFPEVAQGARLA
jgi:ATP-dependent DNA ligase